MDSHAQALNPGAHHPVTVEVTPALHDRDRLTTAFRIILAIPHLLLVGGPIAATLSWSWGGGSSGYDWGAGGGVLGMVAAVVAMIAWFAILFTGKYPAGLRGLAVFYLSWRVRAVSYVALLRDEYPPFGDGDYPAGIRLLPEAEERDRLTVAFRVLLALPHLLAVWCLGIAWAVTTMIAWFAILLTGSYPESLYDFGVGVLRWNTRVEAYLLLLHDEYPPFSLS
jgi:hypothetical protein